MDGAKKAMVENACRVPVGEGGTGAPVPDGGRPPAGCVERVLNFKDRNYIVGACLAYCEKDGHKGFKDQKKLDQVKKLLNFEATLDHTAEITDGLEERTLAWEGARARYKMWRQFKEGLLDADGVEEMRKRHPDLDLEKGPEKPPVRPPELSPEDQRGPESVFHLPSKLDAWIQGALGAMDWPTVMTEYCVELCEKFGVTGGD